MRPKITERRTNELVRVVFKTPYLVGVFLAQKCCRVCEGGYVACNTSGLAVALLELKPFRFVGKACKGIDELQCLLVAHSSSLALLLQEHSRRIDGWRQLVDNYVITTRQLNRLVQLFHTEEKTAGSGLMPCIGLPRTAAICDSAATKPRHEYSCARTPVHGECEPWHTACVTVYAIVNTRLWKSRGGATWAHALIRETAGSPNSRSLGTWTRRA